MIATSLCVAIASTGEAPVKNQIFLLKNRHSVVETSSCLQYSVLTAGSGARPTNADLATVTYKDRLFDGTTFRKSQAPTAMAVSGFIPGFAEGLKLMAKGAKYRF